MSAVGYLDKWCEVKVLCPFVLCHHTYESNSTLCSSFLHCQTLITPIIFNKLFFYFFCTFQAFSEIINYTEGSFPRVSYTFCYKYIYISQHFLLLLFLLSFKQTELICSRKQEVPLYSPTRHTPLSFTISPVLP